MLRNPSYQGHQQARSLATGQIMRVADCNRCGHAIAWAQSKAGKWYPCEVVAKQSEEFGHDHDVLRAQPWRAHRCAPAVPLTGQADPIRFTDQEAASLYIAAQLASSPRKEMVE